jgi:hypothetical protein
MADHICVGIKTDGVRCNKRVAEGQRCRIHLKTVETHGPNATAVRELGYQHKKAVRELEAQGLQQVHAVQDNLQLRNDIAIDNLHELAFLKNRQKREIELLLRAQRDTIRLTGIDPDEAANRRRAAEDEQRRQEFQNRVNQILRHNEERAAANLAQANHRVEAVRPPRGDLADFAADAQNVHTTTAVNATKEMVAIILSIPVPDEYKWNGRECSKTPGEIIMSCRLTPKAAWQMAAKYCQDESIYDLGKGIYGQVLDGVWQYILNSSDKADLCRCLKQEMEDNIGMCAQGNLSRLCNILAGYMEGIGPQESVAELLGRLMPKLMEIDDLSQRLAEAFKIMKDNNVPLGEWKKWLAPLTMDQDVTMDIGFLRNDQDQVIGFLAVEV